MTPANPLPHTQVTTLALLLALSALSPPAASAVDGAHRAAPVATGDWEISPLKEPGKYLLELMVKGVKGPKPWSRQWIPEAELSGFPTTAGRTDAAFDVNREAGTLHAGGVVDHQRGSGTFTLTLDVGFADSLQHRGLGRPSPEQQATLALADAHLDLLDALRDLGYQPLKLDQFVRCAEQHLDRGYLIAMIALGLKAASVDDWLQARKSGVDTAYAAELRAAGFGALSLKDLIATRDHGVDARYLADLAAFGYKGLPLAKLIELRDHGVDVNYLSGLKQAGFTGVTPNVAIEARSHGVDGAYLAGLLDAGITGFTLDEAVRARDHGVDALFAADQRRRLGRAPTLDELIRLRDTANSGN